MSATDVLELDQVRALQIVPEVRRLNAYVRRARHVAVKAIRPIIGMNGDGTTIEAFEIQVQGPSTHLAYLQTLLSEANLQRA